MKKTFILLITVFSAIPLMAQQGAGVSPVGSLNIRKVVVPANINVVENSIQFVDATGNNAIDANERCKILFEVENTGRGDGIGCEVEIRATGTTQAVTVQKQRLPDIPAGSRQRVEIPVTAGFDTKNGQVDFAFEVTEPNGFGTDIMQMTVQTKAFVAPKLQIVDYAVTGSAAGKLKKKEQFDLQLVLQNTEYGSAENVEVEMTVPNGVFVLSGDQSVRYASLGPGSAKSLDYSLIVNNNYAVSEIPIQVKIRERYGRYAENRTITLELNQELASTRINVDAKEQERQDIRIASIGSAVDKNIPVTTIKRSHTFAVVIANEDYRRVAKVPFALNDGRVFAEYCRSALGLPANNVRYLANATLNDIRSAIQWVREVQKAYDDDKIIFYYAGHGIPDEGTRAAYLLPVDGYGTDVTTGYSLEKLYADLSEYPSESVALFMDACFSGAKREGDMIVAARSVAIKVNPSEPQGNMVVFSAAAGNQTAYPYQQEGHGMFTYYLLKKLQESHGDVTYEELGDYIRRNVSQQSIVLNGKSQTPVITPASDLGAEWKTRKLGE